jgi:peptidyl-prolyl cis-trans isomerase B (cyclophilin B)
MRTTLLMIPLLAVTACGSEDPGQSANTQSTEAGNTAADTNTGLAAAQAGPNNAAGADQGTKVNANEVMDNTSITSGQQPLIASRGQGPKYTPKRTPEFRFESGGPILDEQLSEFYVEMECTVDGEDVGTIVIDLWPESAPITVRNFLRYCDEGFYDGLAFHRIAREFMLQGGDPNGNGSGDGPHGSIPAEFSDDPARDHGYGVLSMARGNERDSASSQFFLCCAESPDVWNLDGNYASFGKVVSGVTAIEAMASVPVGGPQRTSPMRAVKMKKVTVKRGELPSTNEVVERPKADIGDEPEIITIQHVLISFQGTGVPDVTRSQAEAEALAKEILAKAKAGEDFTSLVMQYSDDSGLDEKDDLPGSYAMANTGRLDPAIAKAQFREMMTFQKALQEAQQKKVAELRPLFDAKKITMEEAQGQLDEFMKAEQKRLMPAIEQVYRRGEMMSGFGDVGFSLKVGEVGMASYSPRASKFGWHIIRRAK